MTYGDYHVHTNYCDGKSTVDETVRRAIALGLSEIGFTGHVHTPHDTRYCMTEEAAAYLADIEAAKERYGDKINIITGVEQDLFGSDSPFASYKIGSVHYMEIEGGLIPVDESPDFLREAAEKYYGGDMLCICEKYFETVAAAVLKIRPDIIGHFDLIRKFNEKENLFDEASARYIAAWKSALDKLIPLNIPFEINTGAISRGYTSLPYPSESQIKYIAERGGRFILTSDCHAAENLCYEFSKWRDWAKNLGAEFAERVSFKKS